MNKTKPHAFSYCQGIPHPFSSLCLHIALSTEASQNYSIFARVVVSFDTPGKSLHELPACPQTSTCSYERWDGLFSFFFFFCGHPSGSIFIGASKHDCALEGRLCPTATQCRHRPRLNFNNLHVWVSPFACLVFLLSGYLHLRRWRENKQTMQPDGGGADATQSIQCGIFINNSRVHPKNCISFDGSMGRQRCSDSREQCMKGVGQLRGVLGWSK